MPDDAGQWPTVDRSETDPVCFFGLKHIDNLHWEHEHENRGACAPSGGGGGRRSRASAVDLPLLHPGKRHRGGT